MLSLELFKLPKVLTFQNPRSLLGLNFLNYCSSFRTAGKNMIYLEIGVVEPLPNVQNITANDKVKFDSKDRFSNNRISYF